MITSILVPLSFLARAKLPVTCPHCSKEHTVDAVSAEEHTRKMNGKQQELDLTKTQLAEAKKNDSAAAELATLKAQIAERDAKETRTQAFAKAGVAEAARDTFTLVYSNYVDGVPDGQEPLAFDAWLASKEVTDHPVLAPHLGKAPSATPDQKGGEPRKPTIPAPKTEGGIEHRSTDARIKSPEDLRTYFRSDEFRAMKPEEQKARRSELEQQLMRENPAA